MIDAQYMLSEAEVVENNILNIPDYLKTEVTPLDIKSIATAYDRTSDLGKSNFNSLILKATANVVIDEHYIINNKYMEELCRAPIIIKEECSFLVEYTRVNYFLNINISEGDFAYVSSVSRIKDKLFTPAYLLVQEIKKLIKELNIKSYIIMDSHDDLGFPDGITIRGVSSTAGNVSINVNLEFNKFCNTLERDGYFNTQFHSLTKTMRRHSDKTRVKLYNSITPRAVPSFFENDFMDSLEKDKRYKLRYSIITAINDCAGLLSRAVPNSSEVKNDLLLKMIEAVANEPTISEFRKNKLLFKILISIWFNLKDKNIKLTYTDQEGYTDQEELSTTIVELNSAIISVKDVFSLSIVEHQIVKSLIKTDSIGECLDALNQLFGVKIGFRKDIEEQYELSVQSEAVGADVRIVTKIAIDLVANLNKARNNEQK